MNHKFGFLSKLASRLTHEIKQITEELAQSYPNDLKPMTESEFLQFSTLLASSTELKTKHKESQQNVPLPPYLTQTSKYPLGYIC